MGSAMRWGAASGRGGGYKDSAKAGGPNGMSHGCEGVGHSHDSQAQQGARQVRAAIGTAGSVIPGPCRPLRKVARRRHEMEQQLPLFCACARERRPPPARGNVDRGRQQLGHDIKPPAPPGQQGGAGAALPSAAAGPAAAREWPSGVQAPPEYTHFEIQMWRTAAADAFKSSPPGGCGSGGCAPSAAGLQRQASRYQPGAVLHVI